MSNTRRQFYEDELSTRTEGDSIRDIQTTIDMRMWQQRFPTQEPDDIEYGKGYVEQTADMVYADESIMNVDMSSQSPSTDHDEVENVGVLDPEAPLKYTKPGIIVESFHRATVYAFSNTRHEEMRSKQDTMARGSMYPFASEEEYEIVQFILDSGLTYDQIEKLMKLGIVSTQPFVIV